MTNFKKILRTCIFCRGKIEQKSLIRLKCQNENIVPYDNMGRSFYICVDCFEKIQGTLKTKEIKKFEKALKRECKNGDSNITQLKEIVNRCQIK